MILIENDNSERDSKTILNYLNDSNSDLINECNLFSALSRDTWDRLEFAHTRKGLKIYETTITQNILYVFQWLKEKINLNIILKEAIDEKRNGNDIEFIIRIGPESCFFLPMQAKKVYPNLRYPQFDHGYQIDKLIKYAKRVGGIPYYLLYSYSENFAETDSLCSVRIDEKQYGCSIINAYSIKDRFTYSAPFKEGYKWDIPTFGELIPNLTKPWIIIPCCLNGNEMGRDIFEKLKVEDEARKKLEDFVEIYNYERIVSNKNWMDFKFKRSKEINITNEIDKEDYEYNPRFRIIIDVSESQ